jgi:hypothetical protein
MVKKHNWDVKAIDRGWAVVETDMFCPNSHLIEPWTEGCQWAHGPALVRANPMFSHYNKSLTHSSPTTDLRVDMQGKGGGDPPYLDKAT